MYLMYSIPPYRTKKDKDSKAGKGNNTTDKESKIIHFEQIAF